MLSRPLVYFFGWEYKTKVINKQRVLKADDVFVNDVEGTNEKPPFACEILVQESTKTFVPLRKN